MDRHVQICTHYCTDENWDDWQRPAEQAEYTEQQAMLYYMYLLLITSFFCCCRKCLTMATIVIMLTRRSQCLLMTTMTVCLLFLIIHTHNIGCHPMIVAFLCMLSWLLNYIFFMCIVIKCRTSATFCHLCLDDDDDSLQCAIYIYSG